MAIVFLTNKYLPKPMANGVCVHQVAKELAARGEKTIVVCPQEQNEPATEQIDGVEIIRVTKPGLYRTMDYANAHTNKAGKILKTVCTFVRRINRLMHIPQYPLESTGMVRKYVMAVEKLIDGQMPITVVATYTPMEAVAAAALLKKRNSQLKTVFYSLDTMSNEGGKGFLPLKLRNALGKKHEVESFACFDRVILMRCHEHHYSGTDYDQLRNRLIYADFPLFSVNSMPQIIHRDSCEKRIIYAGSFYRWIRNPELVMKCLEPLMDRIRIDFYGYSDCDDIMQPYVEKYRGHVAIHGLVQHNEVKKQMALADIILSIGNRGTEMSPSKIYECIATGKPIIHAFFQDDDPCVNALKKYPNSLCIDMRKPVDVQALSSFLDHAQPVDASRLKDDFIESTPEFTANLIQELFGE